MNKILNSTFQILNSVFPSLLSGTLPRGIVKLIPPGPIRSLQLSTIYCLPLLAVSSTFFIFNSQLSIIYFSLSSPSPHPQRPIILCPFSLQLSTFYTFTFLSNIYFHLSFFQLSNFYFQPLSFSTPILLPSFLTPHLFSITPHSTRPQRPIIFGLVFNTIIHFLQTPSQEQFRPKANNFLAFNPAAGTINKKQL